MNNKLITWITVLALLPATILLLLSFKPMASKTGSVNISYLFQNFQGTLDMEQRVKAELKRPYALLDSLSNKIERLKHTQQNYEETSQKHQLLNRQVEMELNELNAKYTKSIWNQINAYVKAYAEQEQLEYIYGVNGDGNIMYASEEKDITLELLEFINLAYHGE